MSLAVETVAECPICHAAVSFEAAECPRCGEILTPDAFAEDATAQAAERVPGFREKLLFYLGIALILVGGPGIALGSWLHDVLRISFENYNAFDVFGPVNRLVAAVGLIMMILGIVLLVLSLRLSRPAETDLA